MKKARTPSLPDAAYDSWAREQIEATLKAKSEGHLTYKSLDQIAAQFGVKHGRS